VEVPLGDIFSRPVLADFAGSWAEAEQTTLPLIVRAERPERIPLSFAQQRLWFLAQMEGVSEAYHIPGGIRVRGALDRGALRRALDRLTIRHEALRTTCGLVDGEPVQRIASEEQSGFQLLEQRVEDADELKTLMTEEASAPFDLEKGPLVRGRLSQEAEDVHTLLITMHHIVSDGWSTGVLVNEFSALYSAYVKGEEEELPELVVQYADYAIWQRRWMEGELLQAQAKYWEQTLSGAPELLELPTDHPRPAQQNHAGEVVAFSLDETLTKGLKELSCRHGSTISMTLLGGRSVWLSRLDNQGDLLSVTASATRGRRAVDRLI